MLYNKKTYLKKTKQPINSIIKEVRIPYLFTLYKYINGFKACRIPTPFLRENINKYAVNISNQTNRKHSKIITFYIWTIKRIFRIEPYVLIQHLF